ALREAGHLPDPRARVLRQQGHRRAGQRARRRRRRWLRPAAARADRLRALVRPVHARRRATRGGRAPRCVVGMTDAGPPCLSVLTGLPLLGALVIALLPRGATSLVRQIALVTSLGSLGVTIAAWIAFDPNGARFQLRESYPWIPTWDVRFTFAADGIALV